MAVTSLLKEEADILYEMPKRVLRYNNRWIPRSSNSQSSYLILEVEAEDKTEFIVRAWRGTIGKKRYSFALLLKDKTPIRRWDDKIGDEHPIEKIKTTGPHKHYWQEGYDDTQWYETSDVRLGDEYGALFDFMRECNIDITGINIQKDGIGDCK